jgi:hypothetical protein
MEIKLGKEYSNEAQRIAFLKDNCDAVETKGYMKPFSPEQLQGHKEKLADLSIKIEETEEEKRLSAKYFKDAIADLAKQRTEIISNIKKKSEYVNETCFKFIDRENKQTGYYNANGDLVEIRPISYDEMQLNIFSLASKTGTAE